MKNIAIIFVSGLLLSGCYSQTGWTPAVDTYNDPNAYRLNQDMAECRQLAGQASNGLARESALGAGVGGLAGAATGAAIGAIAGNPGKGAIVGATVGGLGGAAKQGYESEANFKRAYNNCLKHRGHHTVN